ncbi:MAG: LabA-like NYN domain-containing protein [Patescibacteria group bacterium]
MANNNYAFIDSQNLNLAVRDQGWILDFGKFKKYLENKYSATKCFLFIGFIDENQSMYTALQKMGYIIIFKPTLTRNGTVKGNCDAELVLQAMIEIPNYDQAIIVTGDGDFYCLVDYLDTNSKLKVLLIPNKNLYSSLFKKVASGKKWFVNDLKLKLEYKGSRTRRSSLKESDSVES